jgi:SAM-dependent methyltransferase
MPASVQALYATPAVRELLRVESLLSRARIRRRSSGPVLHLSMTRPGEAPVDVYPSQRIHLCWRQCELEGDVRARCDEALPFADDAFACVLVSHVHQHVADAPSFLKEAARVVMPDGIVLVSGLHPVSAWIPWLWWRFDVRRRSNLRLFTPFELTGTLVTGGLDVESAQRFGAVLPHTGPRARVDTLGGGYMLAARKRRQSVTPLRPWPARRTARMGGSLPTGANRECA